MGGDGHDGRAVYLVYDENYEPHGICTSMVQAQDWAGDDGEIFLFRLNRPSRGKWVEQRDG